jgi:hypothetical protein
MNRRQSFQKIAQGLSTPWLIKAGAWGTAAVAVSGCAGPQVADYSQQKPKLDLRTYFNGEVEAWVSSPTAAVRWSNDSRFK